MSSELIGLAIIVLLLGAPGLIELYLIGKKAQMPIRISWKK
jgi:hypothetical protein